MHFRKVLSTLLCGALMLSAMPMASAAYQTPVTVTSEAAIFNVTIPTALPVSVNDHGAVTTATNATITNDSWGPIVIAGLAVTGTNDWATADYDGANMTAEKVNTKKVAMDINTCKTTGANAINFQSSGFGSIHGKGGTQAISYDAKLPAQASAISSQNIVNTTFTVAWDSAIVHEDWDTNPMTSAEVTAANLAFDSSTGTMKAGSTKPTGVLSLPSSVDGVRVTSIGSQAFSWCSGLTSVTIPKSIVNIGDYAFMMSTNMASFVSESPNYRVENERYLIRNSDNTLIAFAPYNTTSVTIPSGVATIGASVFGGLSNIKSVVIPDGVNRIGNQAFEVCSGLTSVTISNSVTYIGDYAFQKCTGLASLTIPNSVTHIGDAAFWQVQHIYYYGSYKTGSPWGAAAIN